MGIDYILYRQRIEMMRAEVALCAEARLAHWKLAKAYAARARSLRAPAVAIR